mmetsp:Transcript_36625/g.57184  ORF Transcript_36625/g.57184 Transcript_36625/m.57184 type:complete len:495 (-) Transcript_36625:408-1892(-)
MKICYTTNTCSSSSSSSSSTNNKGSGQIVFFWLNLWSCLNLFKTTHVWPQHLGNGEGAVLGVVVVLQHSHQRTAHRQARPVHRVRKCVLLLAVLIHRPVTQVHPAPLEVRAVGAGGNLPEGLLARQPDLQVVAETRPKPNIPGAEAHLTVGQTQQLQRLLGVLGELFVLGLGLLLGADLHQLHLVELVLAEQPARVPAVRAGLRAEAGRARREGQGQRLALQDLAPVQVREGDLRGRDQEGVLPRGLVAHLEQVVLELGQLAGAAQRAPRDDVGRRHLQVPVLQGVQVEGELHERALEPSHGAREHREPRPAQPGRALGQEPAQLGCDLVMPEVLLTPLQIVRVPFPDELVLAVVVPLRHRRVQQVRQRVEERGQLLLDLRQAPLRRLRLPLGRLHLGLLGRRQLLVPGLHRLADLCAQRLAHPQGGVPPADELPAGAAQLLDPAHGGQLLGAGAAGRQVRPDALRVLRHKPRVVGRTIWVESSNCSRHEENRA